AKVFIAQMLGGKNAKVTSGRHWSCRSRRFRHAIGRSWGNANRVARVSSGFERRAGSMDLQSLGTLLVAAKLLRCAGLRLLWLRSPLWILRRMASRLAA